MDGMAAVPAWAPPGRSHLLRSTAVVRSVSYLQSEISYDTSNATADDVLRVTVVPNTVSVSGQPLVRRTDLAQPGWTFDPDTGILRIRRDSGSSVTISSGAPDTVLPLVSSNAPVAGAEGVPVGLQITATFSEAMQASSIMSATFYLTDGTQNIVPATVSYSSATTSATLFPTSPLQPNAMYVATLRGGTAVPRVRDLAGNSLLADHTWTFTTSSTPTLPSLQVFDTTTDEGQSPGTTLRFTVSLSAASSQTVTVNYATSNGSAQAGTDFLATSGQLTFSPGAMSQPIDVAIVADMTFENDETLFVEITQPTGATIADGQAVGTIRNDDAAPPAVGLVAAYGFNETTGTAAADASGNNRTGTVSGAAWNPAGRFGGALNFDGVNDWVTVADAAALDLATGLTLSAWVQPTTNAGWRTVAMKEAPGGLAYVLYTSDGLRPNTAVNTGAGDLEVSAGAAPPLNTWTYLSATYDGATLRLFVNGTQVGTRAIGGAIRTTTGALRLGGNNVWGEHFQGRLDEVRLYSRALSAAEIQTDMNTPVAPAGPDTAAPSVTVTAPTPAAIVAGTVLVSVAASDNVGVTSVQFFLDDLPLGAPDTSEPFSSTWDTTTVGNGAHAVTAVARDAAGNETTAAPVSVTVRNDLTPPSVTLLTPPAGDVVGTLTVAASASDDIGVTSVQFLLDGAPLGPPDTAAPFEFVWNTLATTNGAHGLAAQARDASGKQTTTPVVAVTVANPTPPSDTTPPTVTITNPPASATVSGTINLTADASDNVGVTSVQFQVNGVDLGAPDTVAPYVVVWNTAASPTGSGYQVQATARDAAANTTTSIPVTVTIANAAPTGLVAAYGFNETTGTAAADASGNNRTGTVSGAAWNPAGRFGGALNFDGVNDRVNIPDAAVFDLTTGMTLSAWVRPTALTGWRTVIMKEAPGGLAYALYAHDNAPYPATTISFGGADQTTPGTAPLTTNTWTHLAVTYNGTTLRLFVNGSEVAARTVSGSIRTTNSALRIGGNAVWGEYFQGLLDNVRIYNRALTVSEIQTDMNTPVGGS
jgi:hypothetical protein